MDNKYAILSMDIEDWHNLDYFHGKATDKSVSMLDGLKNYVDLLDAHNIKTTFFALSELIPEHKDVILYAASHGHEIACHGKTHIRPLMMEKEKFREEITQAKAELEDLLGKEVIGYRAPCYSIDNERYDIVREVGFKYSSSRMNVPGHPLYGDLDLTGFDEPMQGIYEKDGFYEFSLSTQKLLGKHIAVSGGGWIRLFPWQLLMKPMINKYLATSQTYTLYIHPFELSKVKMPHVDGVAPHTVLRAHKGLGKVDGKVEQLIDMLGKNNFECTTFGDIVNSRG